MSHLHWSPFCRCAINRLSHAFPCTQNVFTNGDQILKIYLACSFADAMFSLGNFRDTLSALCLSCTHMAFPRANLHISVFCTCVTHQKVASVSSCTKSFSYTHEKSERLGFLAKDKVQNFERQSVLSKCAVDFHDFQERIRQSHNSLHVCPVYRPIN